MMKIHLQNFEKYRGLPLTFESFDLEFYQKFMKYLTYDYPLMRKKILTKGLRINSIAKTIKWLKAFLRDRMGKKIIPYFDVSLFKVHEEDVDAIYLSWQEISSMSSLMLLPQLHHSSAVHRETSNLTCMRTQMIRTSLSLLRAGKL